MCPLTITLGGEAVTLTETFGPIPAEAMATATLEHANHLRTALFQASRQDETGGEPYRVMLDEFRQTVGALYFRLQEDITKDIRYVSIALAHPWRSWPAVLFGSRVRPTRHLHACGTEGYSGLATFLGGLAARPETCRNWGFPSEAAFVDSVFRTIRHLHDQEQEFRSNVIAAMQVGIGMGGMIAGLVGIVISVAVSLASPLSSYRAEAGNERAVPWPMPTNTMVPVGPMPVQDGNNQLRPQAPENPIKRR